MLENNDENNLDRIDQLKKGLYSKTASFLKRKSKLHSKKYNVKTDWGGETLSELTNQTMKKKLFKKKKDIIGKSLVVAIILFIIALGAVSLNFFGGANRVSTANVDISAVGPASVESGSEMSLQVTIANNNSADLKLVDLIVTYPKGSRSIDNKELNKFRESLDVIPAGESVKREVKAVLYGEENSEKNIVISLEYRIAGSNAIFFKEKNYDLMISSSPINLVISPIEKTISGQEIEFSVNIISNTNAPINNLLVSVEYPFGFEFESSNPKPNFDDNVWKITNGNKVIKIKGRISGQEGEEKVFKFICGTKSDGDEKVVGAIFALTEKSLIIERPFMGINLAINGESSQDYVLSPSRPIRVDVTWQNNSMSKILDGEIAVKLKGDIIDKSSVNVERGFYQSSSNSIVWDKRTNGELSEINTGDGGRFSFYFQPVDLSLRSSFTNPEILIDISAKGNRVSENGVPEEITSTISRTIKLSSDLMVTPLSTYLSGPFINSGPLPPKVDKDTTYTITWAITNTMNDTFGVEVKSSLPPYVRWLGVVSPISENISYNPVGGEIIWDVGDIKSGTGSKTPPKEISFQVALLPSINQVGDILDLTNEVIITGIDNFTSSSLESIFNGVTTRISTDPGFTNLKAIVAK